ncbi:MAG: SGNH/GDSL hydrolase family protein [Pirellulales bacterium]|nr:SGNH/GDSL hydrolase family protein [Pirellulales bacterium]
MMTAAKRSKSSGVEPARSRRAFRWVAVGGALLISLLAAEIVLRVFDIRPERYAPPRWVGWNGYEFARIPGWGKGIYKNASRYESLGVKTGEHVPGTRFKVFYASNPRGYFDADNGLVYQINSQGLHGPEVSVAKPAGVIRVLGLGDSFTFGQGVREPDTFLRQLEGLLNQGHGGDARFEVLNAGVQGYNTRDEVVYFERQWLTFDPDLVIIQFYLNDAYSDYTFLNHGQTLGIYLEQSRAAKISRIADLAEYAYRNWRLQRNVASYYRAHYFRDARRFLNNPGDTSVDWQTSRDALARAAQLCRERHIDLVLVMFPELYQLRHYPFGEIHQLVADTAQSLGIPALDLLADFQRYDDRDLWVHPSDHHPNELAHAIAARRIAQWLASLHLPRRHAAASPAPETPSPAATPEAGS